jgi:hypothetical protein
VEGCVSLVAPAIRSDRSDVAGLCGVVASGVAFCVDLRRSAIRSASEPRLVVESAEGRSACGVRVGSVDGVRVGPIRGEDCRTRELSGVVPAEERVELSFGVGLTLLDGLGAGVALVDGRLD